MTFTLQTRTGAQIAQAQLDAAKARAQRDLVVWVDAKSAEITGLVPRHEVISWSVKVPAATAVIAGTATPEQTALIHTEAALTGETDAELAALVLALSTPYLAAIANLTGLRRSVRDAITAAPDVQAVATALAQADAAWTATQQTTGPI